MLLTFSKDLFVSMIKSGHKIHTIREDKSNRWHQGRSIQFWRGNPRNVKSLPYQFMDGECKGVQEIHIFRKTQIHCGTYEEIEELAKNDGLTTRQLREWFVPWQQPVFSGKIIHWTDKMY